MPQQDYKLIRQYIEKNSGIVIGDDKLYLLESRLSIVLEETGLESIAALQAQLINHRDRELSIRIIDAITTNETFWFRDLTPWKVLLMRMPKYIEELRSGQRVRVRIWSAACATGQEPYSTAITIDQYLKHHQIDDIRPAHFQIVATDISSKALKAARRGSYDNVSISRGLSEFLRDQYFTKEGRLWVLNDFIRNQVEFHQHNLQDSVQMLGEFDIIFCRYVIIYFAEELKQTVLKNAHGQLAKHGIIFFGNSEIISDTARLFRQSKTDGAVYYEKRT